MSEQPSVEGGMAVAAAADSGHRRMHLLRNLFGVAVLALGSFVAGSKGPVADLRPLAAVLAAIPVVVAIGALLLARLPALRARVRHLWEAEGRHPRVKSAEDALGRLWARILTVRPSP